MESQPGKQAVTFLLAANLAIFIMNLFESEKAGVSEIIIGKNPFSPPITVQISTASGRGSSWSVVFRP